MITLFIDTSSADVSIAVLEDNKILSSISKSIPNQHSVYTVSFLEQVLKEATITPESVNKILVVVGPGSFTGVRIGVTIAKVYAYLENIEIITVSSLKMLALSANNSHYYLSLIDARHDHYYIGLYDQDYQEVIPEQFNTKEKVLELIEKYHPMVISNEEIQIDDYSISKQVLDISKIVSYYQDKESINSHFVVPNYLKLPQALEEKHD